MRANEYVKLVGWEYAKLNASSCSHQYYFLHNGYAEVCVSELKRLVESHELIERVGGLSLAKDFYEKFECVHIGLNLIECRKLGRAIKDVESCK